METHQQQHQNNTEKTPPTNPASSSPSSSPSHEFSFTISLHPPIPENSKAPPPNPLAVDLSPADDIFFHGHLLPLHLLSHFPSATSPRFSTNSLESFTLPIREDKKLISKDSSSCNTSNREEQNSTGTTTKEENRAKTSTFSLFGLTKGRKGKEEKEKHKRKLGYEVIHALKRYLRMVIFRGRREKVPFHGQAYSHSGNLMRRSKPEVRGRGRRGECSSAPASMRASPTNSGLLLATTTLPPATDSTMEELQAAIQAAIAHCKKSIAKEDIKLSSCS